MGFVQGLTEFLPVSSSAHLVFASHFLKIHLGDSDTVSFDVLVHLATLLAVFIYFRKDVMMLIRGAIKLIASPGKAWKEDSYSRLFGLLIIGTLPVAFMLVCFKEFFSMKFLDVPLSAAFLLLTAVMLFWISSRPEGAKQIDKLRPIDGLVVGLFQVLALFPGISRSGSTITGSLFRGMDKETAPRFAFLLSIPVILGGGLIDLKKLISQGTDIHTSVLLIGFVTAAISGYIAIIFLLNIVKRGKLHYFAIYCVIISVTLSAYWQFMVPKLDYNTISATAVDEKNPSVYNEATKEITAVNLGGIVSFKFAANPGNYPVVDAKILVPTGMVGKKKNRLHYDVIECIPAGEGAFVSEKYKVVPLESATLPSDGETREIRIILTNSIGVERDIRVLMRVVEKNRVAQIWGSGKVYRQ